MGDGKKSRRLPCLPFASARDARRHGTDSKGAKGVEGVKGVFGASARGRRQGASTKCRVARRCFVRELALDGSTGKEKIKEWLNRRMKNDKCVSYDVGDGKRQSRAEIGYSCSLGGQQCSVRGMEAFPDNRSFQKCLSVDDKEMEASQEKEMLLCASVLVVVVVSLRCKMG